eukprot:6773315-Prymnesium_polylepis.3
MISYGRAVNTRPTRSLRISGLRALPTSSPPSTSSRISNTCKPHQPGSTTAPLASPRMPAVGMTACGAGAAGPAGPATAGGTDGGGARKLSSISRVVAVTPGAARVRRV